MATRLIRCGLVLAGFFSFATFGADWASYQPGNSACYIRLPANPEYQTQIVDAMVTHIYVAKDASRTPAFVYTVSFGDYPKEKFVDENSPKKILDADRDGFVKAVNGKIVSEKSIEKGAYPGREVAISGEGGKARYVLREYLIENRIFHLAACVPAASVDDADVTRFFESFQLAKK
ncbi:MAG TPA: hypothetical protein VKX17_07125 [Planctomycetota bacterium]|nr:hypothetical protein [Planctomycetota bacterium]